MRDDAVMTPPPEGSREPADWEDSAGKALVVLQDGLNLLADAFTQLQSERSAMRARIGELRQQHDDDQAELQRHAAFAERVAEIAVVAERLGLANTLPAGLLTELQAGTEAVAVPPPPPPVPPRPVDLPVAGADAAPVPQPGDPEMARVRRARRFVPFVLGAFAGIAALVFVLAATAVLVPALSALEWHRVDSGAMEPAVPRGALVAGIGSRAGRLAPGAIALFEAPNGGGWVTRRIQRTEFVGETLQVATGREDGTPDPWLLDGNARVYRFRFFVPLLGYPLAGLDTLPGRVATVAVPLLVLALLVFALRRSLRGSPAAVE